MNNYIFQLFCNRSISTEGLESKILLIQDLIRKLQNIEGKIKTKVISLLKFASQKVLLKVPTTIFVLEIPVTLIPESVCIVLDHCDSRHEIVKESEDH